MAESKIEAIGVEGNEAGIKPGTLHSDVYSSSDRVTRAAQALAICWLLAAITLFIPLAHFVLVPAFLILGPIVAYSKYRAEMVPNHAEGGCPECGEEIVIKLDSGDKLPKRTYCPACNKPLHLMYHSPPSE